MADSVSGELRQGPVGLAETAAGSLPDDADDVFTLRIAQPLNSDSGCFGTQASPDWRRQAFTRLLGPDRRAPIDLLVTLAEQAGDFVRLALDIRAPRKIGLP